VRLIERISRDQWRDEEQAPARGCRHMQLSSSMRQPVAYRFNEAYGVTKVPKRYVKDYRPRARNTPP